MNKFISDAIKFSLFFGYLIILLLLIFRSVMPDPPVVTPTVPIEPTATAWVPTEKPDPTATPEPVKPTAKPPEPTLKPTYKPV